jgi:lipase chaperone LimK
MNIKNTKFIIIALVILAVGITGYIIYAKQSKDVPVNIVSSGRNVSVKDAKMFLKGFPAQSANEDPRKYFSRDIVNLYTIRFFKFIQHQMEFTTREQHLEAVKKYLYSVLDPQKADEMFALYEKFLDYEIGLREKTKSWTQPRTTDELLKYLQTIHNYRREIFGTDEADAMWGAEVKAREYSIRKNGIMLDKNLYGAEKEKKIGSLKEEMWGNDAASIEDPPQTDPEKFASYQEKQAIYQRDLQELPEDQRLEKIKEFRKDFFSPEQISRLEKVDEDLEAEKRKETDYYAREKEIINDSSLDDNKKAESVKELQNHVFGDEADAFRRRMNIRNNVK